MFSDIIVELYNCKQSPPLPSLRFCICIFYNCKLNIFFFVLLSFTTHLLEEFLYRAIFFFGLDHSIN